MRDYLQSARDIRKELTAIRQQLHRHPELGNEEWNTAALIEKSLQSYGIATQRFLGTAVLGTLHGAGEGKTVALRADMDALPLTEQTGADFSSEEEGIMHACGHDVHVTAVLGAARLLSQSREKFSGTVKFLFQPDEEGSGGARRLIEAGCLDGVDAVFGAHVDPDTELGSVGIRFGKFYAAADIFDITVHGKSAHGATPEKGIDALRAAASLICALHELPQKISKDRCVLHVGSMHAGTARNIIADTATFSGILRTLGPENRRNMKQAIQETIQRIASDTGTIMDVDFRESYGGVVNHDRETQLSLDTAAALLGNDHIRLIQEPLMTTEDFGYYLEHRGGCFYHLGAGCSLPLHNPAFLPQEESYIIGSAMHAAVIEAYLNT